jgi:hypothetical protein
MNAEKIRQIIDFKSAYDAGFDCGLNGANNFNSHYKWFLSKISMQDWERGKRNAEAKNAKPKGR